MPRVILGSPLYNRAEHVREAIEAILNQTFSDFALVLVDDGSADATPEIAREYESLDRRVSYIRNEERLGLIDNSCRVFDLARARHPEAEYFAWVSDHDLWHPHWLEQLVEALDANPEVVLAYPLNRRIGPAGEILKRKPWTFDTFGVASRWKRLRASIVRMRAGNMVYGLYRIGALQRAGVYRKIVVPDRLLCAELALHGQFKQVPQVLWFRRWYGRVFSLERQRASFYPGGRRPLYAYCPWWIGHAVSLFWTFTVFGDGRPQISRIAGARAAVEYLMLAGAVHARQTARAARSWLVERGAAGWHRVRLVLRSMARQGLVNWTTAHFEEYVGSTPIRKTTLQLRRRLGQIGFEAVRRPGLALLRLLRAIPIVRKRAIPALLKEELDEIPAAATADVVKRELEQLQRSDKPLIVGPWVGEVGFELLYWIPFLNWALPAFGLDRRRIIVVSRGGAAPWYRHLTREYVDVFSLFSLDEYRQANEARWNKAGHQKQYRIEQMDLDIVGRAQHRLGLADADLLHPSLMYRLLRFYWFEKAGIGLLKHHTEYRRLAPVERSARLKDLPQDYVAVRFYFRPSFPDTPDNQRFATDVIRVLSREIPVVLLNTGLRPDEHADLNVSGMGVHRVDRLMQLEQNLEVQTEIVSHARAFVGTYGGLAYLGPFYGVPSFSFYSTEAELVPAHLDVSWRLGLLMGVSVSTVHTQMAGLLGTLFSQPLRAHHP